MVAYDPEVMKIKICPKCKGHGKCTDQVGNVFICDRCEGYGRVVEKTLKTQLGLDELTPQNPFDPDEMKIKICKACKGLGTVAWGGEQDPCEECRGDGRFVEHKVVSEYRLNEVAGLAEAAEAVSDRESEE